jgi:hypothetical protein
MRIADCGLPIADWEQASASASPIGNQAVGNWKLEIGNWELAIGNW